MSFSIVYLYCDIKLSYCNKQCFNVKDSGEDVCHQVVGLNYYKNGNNLLLSMYKEI